MADMMDDNSMDSQDADDFDSQADADTLSRAEEIKSDPDRHQRAVTHLAKIKDNATSALKTSRQSLIHKTGNRLRKAFGAHGPADDGDSQFDRAGNAGASSPFNQASR
jgi:hypothetical protein